MHKNRRLFIAFAALICFQTGYMRLNLMTVERAGLLERENLIFILYCAAMVLGMLLAPLLLDSTRLAGACARLCPTVRICLGIAALLAVAGYCAGGYAALALQFFATLFYAGALAACLRVAAGSIVPRHAGRMYGFACAAMHAVNMALFYQPFIAVPAAAVLVFLCVLLAVAGLCFAAGSPGPVTGRESTAPFTGYLPLTPRIIRLAVVVLVLLVVFAGLMDNMFYFAKMFTYIPNFHFYLFAYNIVIYLAAGLLFERVDPGLAAVGALALICASQSMMFFSPHNFLAYPYAFLSNAGFLTMQVYLFSLPVAYVAHTGQKPGVLPGLGFILLNGSYCAMATLFEFLPSVFYSPVLGIMLLLAITAVLVTVYLINENKTHRLGLLHEELRAFAGKPVAEAIDIDLIDPLTDREQEVLQFILTGKSNKEIAAAMFISEGTVKFHAGNIYAKYGVGSRAALISALLRQKNNV